MLTIPDPVVGGGLAFLSHFVLDYIGETGYKSKLEGFAVEVGLMAVYAMGAMATGHPWLMAWAWVASNLPDLIDKPRDLIFGKPQWFSCHNGKGFLSVNGWKFGFPVVYKLTYAQTLLINIASTFLFLFLCL